MNNVTAETEIEKVNKGRRPGRLDGWRTGTGRPFRLLEPGATWTITGNSLAAKTYNSRDEFIDTVIKPFNARLTKPLVQTRRSLHTHARHDRRVRRAKLLPWTANRIGTPTPGLWNEGRQAPFFDAIAFDEYQPSPPK